MTGAGASGGPVAADRLVRRVRAGGAALAVFLAILAIASLIVQARTLSSHVEALREARSDNRTWLVSQLEVDLARLDSALRAVRAGDPAALAQQRLDILISRATLLNPVTLRLDSGDTPDGPATIAAVTGGVEALTARIDAWPAEPGLADIDAALTMVSALATPVRDLSLAVLSRSVSLERAQRDTTRAMLGQFVSLAILLVVLLTGVVLVITDLYRDLSRRVQAAGRIRSNLEKTIEAARDAVVVCDADGCIRSFNAAAERMFARPRADALGADAATLLVPAPGATGIAALAEPETPGAAGALVTGRRSDGTTFPMEVSRVTDTDSDGRIVHFVTLRDVSSRVAAENALRDARDSALHSAEIRARFLAVMSHEMRTPLNGVIAALDLIGKGPVPASQRRLLGLAATSAQTALRQIEDLLDLYRQDGTGAAEPVAPFDPAEALRDAVEVARAPAALRGNRLALVVPDDGPGPVTGLPVSFGRAATNLIANAVKFTRDGTITVSLAADPPDAAGRRRLTVTVADTGSGIAPEDHARVFEDFETVAAAPSGGSGLGLGIARRAVRAMGGQLTLDSAPGQGSVFRFTAQVGPAAAAPAESGAEGQAAAGPAPPLHVLLAEDNPINSYLMQEMLRRFGHTVQPVADGRAAVAAAAAAAFDLLVVDVAMPGLDGLSAIAEIRASPGPSRHAPALVVTAQHAPEVEAQAVDAGATTVLVKPVRLDALGAAIAQRVAPPDDPLIDRAVVADAHAVLGPAQHAALFARFAADLDADLHGPGTTDAALHRAAGAAAILGARRLHRLLAEAGAGRRDMAAIAAALAATRAAMPVAAAPLDPPVAAAE